MALHPGWATNAASTALDARLRDAGTLTKNADGSVRTGILWSPGMTQNVVTTRSDLSVNISAAVFVCSKGTADGATILANDGVVVSPATATVTAARTDVVWVKQFDNTTGDSVSTPQFGITAGSTATPTTKPVIPTGAVELATLQFNGSTTATSSASLFNTGQFTVPQGGVVPFTNMFNLRASTPEIGTLGKILDGGAGNYGTAMYIYQAVNNWKPLADVVIADLAGSGSGSNALGDGARTDYVIASTLGSSTDSNVIEVTNTTTITAKITGRYRITTVVIWTANSAGNRGVEVVVNGSALTPPAFVLGPASGVVASGCNLSTIVSVSAGAVIKIQGGQNSGGALAYTTRTQIEFLA